MTNLSNLSTEELKGMLGSESNLSNFSTDELKSAIEIPRLLSSEPIKEYKSPLSNIERMRLSFADENGKESILKKQFKVVQPIGNGKFMVGDTPESLVPVDPNTGFSEILGDLSDIIGEIPSIAGQITGSTMGTVAGPAGIIAGGAIGSGIGEAAKQAIGTSLGVRENKAIENATDIAISTMFGAAGEALGQSLKFAGNQIIKPKAKILIDKALSSSSDKKSALNGIAKVVSFMTQMDEEKVISAGLYGFNKTLSRPYTNPKHIDNLVASFAKGAIAHNEKLGKAVEVGDRWASKYFGGKTVELSKHSSQLLNALKSDRVGIVDSIGRIDRSKFVDPKDYRTFLELSRIFFDKGESGNLIPKDLTLKKTIDYKKSIRPLMNSYFKSSGKNPEAQIAIAKFMNGLTDEVAKKTIPEGASLTEDVIMKNPFLSANKAFSSWKNDLSLLKENGLDITDLGKLSGAEREGKILSSKLERFTQLLSDKTSSAMESFRIISDKIPIRFSGGGVDGNVGNLYDEFLKFDAAQAFSKSNPNILRFSTIASMAGLGYLSSDNVPGGKLTGIGLGALLATPSGMKTVLKSGENIVKGSLSAEKGATKIASSRTVAAIMSKLLSQQTQSRDSKRSEKSKS